MTGHMLGGAGGVELVATVMALSEGIVPPTIGLKEPDPECDLDYTPNKARKFAADIALSNSLGFGGHNGCIALRKINL
jgi:3-oxoacyl-[acyl-carrier-protein] synthase II